MNLENSNKTLDRQGFEILFKEYYNPLCYFALRFVNDKDSAREIVQEVFINLWQKKESIQTDKPIKSYLFTSVKNRSLNHIRDQKKFRSYYLDVEIELEIPFEEEDIFEEDELQNRIDKALDKLPKKCREVFELKRFEDMKYLEIAKKLNISVKTVEVHMSKALKVMREELKDLFLIFMIITNL